VSALLEEEELLLPEEEDVPAAAVGFTTVSIFPTLVLMFSNCSSELNCANCVTNCVLSAGLIGSWFFNCATSNVRKVLSFAIPAVEPEELELEEVAAVLDPEDVTELTLDIYLDSLFA
jgi:hypothetical protein